MSATIIFLLGSLFGCAVATLCIGSIHIQRVRRLRDEFICARETIRRYAYARGYEEAKAGGIKRA